MENFAENSIAPKVGQNIKTISDVKVSRHAKIRDIRAKNTKIDFSKVFACIALFAFMTLMLAKPDYYLASAQKGLTLFATSVLPSLFPFYFCSLMLTYMGAVKGISGLCAKPVKLLFNTPKESA